MRTVCCQHLTLLICAVLLLVGCVPQQSNTTDEKREAHYIAGMARVRAMDYEGAIQEFEKALQANPSNASAHFELGWLYEKDERDLVGAIYHYDRYLRLRPNAPNADAVRARLQRCKQLLASTVTPISTAPTLQREIERLTAENMELKRQIETLRAYLATYLRTMTQTVTSVTQTQPQQYQTTSPPSVSVQGTAPQSVQTQPSPPSFRKHTIRQGETLYIIARKYGVSVDALLKANPGIDPRKLQVGQTINVPTQ